MSHIGTIHPRNPNRRYLPPPSPPPIRPCPQRPSRSFSPPPIRRSISALAVAVSPVDPVASSATKHVPSATDVGRVTATASIRQPQVHPSQGPVVCPSSEDHCCVEMRLPVTRDPRTSASWSPSPTRMKMELVSGQVPDCPQQPHPHGPNPTSPEDKVVSL